MKTIQEKIEQAKIFDMPDALHGQVYEFTKSELLSLLKEVAEEQRDIDYAIARSINKDIADLISITPLVTDKIK